MTTPYGARALAAEVARLAAANVGERNNTLNNVWIKLCQRINAGHLDRDTAYRQVYDTALKIGLDGHEVSATMHSAENGAASHPWPVPPPEAPQPGYNGFAQPGGTPDDATSTEAAPDGGAEVAIQQAVPLPDAFWRERKILEHIRQAAFSRGLSAEAVLGAALARIAADTPHTVKLPPLVGKPCGLTLITALTGPPGSGKSSSKGVAVELIPPHMLDAECDDVPPGSGEGMLEILFTLEEDPETGKMRKAQTRYNAFMYADEGEVLAMQARRNASNTILPTLRSAFTDATLGQANASIERRRRIPAGRYVYGIVLGIQPDKAADLLSDAGGGTPQRFLWMPTNTPSPDVEPDWPGEVDRPGLGEPEFTDRYGHSWLDVHPDIKNEVKARARHRRQHGVDEMEEHADLIRLKVAGVLAILDGRRDINDIDWQLAEAVMLVSAGTRQRVVSEVQQQTQDANRARGQMEAERHAIVRTKEDTDDQQRAIKSIRRKLQRVGDWVNQSALRDVCGKYREHYSAAIDAMLETGEIEGRDNTNRGKTTTQYRLAGTAKNVSVRP